MGNKVRERDIENSHTRQSLYWHRKQRIVLSTLSLIFHQSPNMIKLLLLCLVAGDGHQYHEFLIKNQSEHFLASKSLILSFTFSFTILSFISLSIFPDSNKWYVISRLSNLIKLFFFFFHQQLMNDEDKEENILKPNDGRIFFFFIVLNHLWP